jgi:hypothetical protein
LKHSKIKQNKNFDNFSTFSKKRDQYRFKISCIKYESGAIASFSYQTTYPLQLRLIAGDELIISEKSGNCVKGQNLSIFSFGVCPINHLHLVQNDDFTHNPTLVEKPKQKIFNQCQCEVQILLKHVFQ